MKEIQRICDYTVVDLEMTGLAAKDNKIIEIGAVKVRNHQIVDTYQTLVNPHCGMEPFVIELTGIQPEMLLDGQEEDPAMEKLLAFIGQDVLIGHNVRFDFSFINQWAVNKKIKLSMDGIDTLRMARALLPEEQKKKLEALCVYFDIPRVNAHRALDDAIETVQIYEKLADLAEEKDRTLLQVFSLAIKQKRQTPATPHQICVLQEFRERHHITEPIEWEILTRSQASRLLDAYRAQFPTPINVKKKKRKTKTKRAAATITPAVKESHFSSDNP